MNSKNIRDIAVDALEEMQGVDIVVLDVKTITTITDYMIICTGRSTRHVKSLADNVVSTAKEAKVSFVRSEGNRESEWILVDLGDVVIQVMLAATREFYGLEDLWQPLKELREQNSNN